MSQDKHFKSTPGKASISTEANRDSPQYHKILAMKASFYISSNRVFTVIPQIRRHTNRAIKSAIK